ncbi:unnamed protein product [Tuber aestivum]|uniref:Uncharacterized protein n=1 Tax=Tuber aestivum TaxID=59557 RepID=A0A292PQI6_9PEZI|nr:unnamed protein product [Tuber aestivum]
MSGHQISRGFRSALARHPRPLYLRPTHHPLHLPRLGLTQPIHRPLHLSHLGLAQHTYHPLHPSRLGMVQHIRAQSYTTNGRASGGDYLETQFARLEKELFVRLEKSIESLEKRFEEKWERRFEGLEKRFEGLEKRLEGLEKRLEGLEKRLENTARRNHEWTQFMIRVVVLVVIGKLFYDNSTEKRLSKRQDDMEKRLTTMIQNAITQLKMELKLESQEGSLSGQNKKQ